jgi:hypothetical protein
VAALDCNAWQADLPFPALPLSHLKTDDNNSWREFREGNGDGHLANTAECPQPAGVALPGVAVEGAYATPYTLALPTLGACVASCNESSRWCRAPAAIHRDDMSRSEPDE